MRSAERQDTRASQIYQLYRDDHEQLVKARSDSEQSLDKALLTLSSGALAFSLTLVKQAFDPLMYPILLVCAWSLFGLSIAMILVSFIMSKKSYDRALEILDDKYENESWGEAYSNYWATATAWLNVASASAFLLALLLLLCFGIMNVV